MVKRVGLIAVAVGATLVAGGVALAQQLAVDINTVSEAGVGEKIGTVTITEGKSGTTFKVVVNSIAAGQHGFHVHDKGDCSTATKDGKTEAAGAAGPHFDPDARKSHKGPQGAGHKGDLPALTASAKGIDQSVTAPKLKLDDVKGRALVSHKGGYNDSDNP